MGGKGQRRREKNYLSAHGGGNSLPPPPKAKELDAIPSKLRRIMEFQSNSNPANKKEGLTENLKSAKNVSDNRRKRGGVDVKKKDQNVSGSNSQSEIKPKSSVDREKDKKRKNKKRKDLPMFLDDATNLLSKKKRKKEFLEARKKKNKKAKVENIRDFPGREKIKFGEIVAAPPKLTFPKISNSGIGAAKERLRLQAVEAYRSRKGWISRPGMQIPLTES